MNKLVTKLKSRNPPPVVLLKGDEPYFRAQALRAAKAIARKRGHDIEIHDGASDSEGEIVDSLDSYSLFSGGDKLVIITNAEKIKGKKKSLCACVQDPSEGVIAIFDGKGAVGTPLGKVLNEHAYVYESKKLSPYKGDIEKWLIKEAHSAGKSLDKNLARAIQNAVGNDLYALRRALTKVILHCDGDYIHKDDIRAVLIHTASTQTYELTNAFGARNMRKVLFLVDRFYRHEDDPTLLLSSALLKHVERLIRAKSLLEYGLDSGDAAKVLGMHPYLFKTSLMPQLKEWKLPKLLDCFDGMCEIDILLKGSGLNKRVLLENVLVRHLS